MITYTTAAATASASAPANTAITAFKYLSSEYQLLSEALKNDRSWYNLLYGFPVRDTNICANDDTQIRKRRISADTIVMSDVDPREIKRARLE